MFPEDPMASFVQSWKSGKKEDNTRIAFATPELLWQVIAAKRRELLKALCGAGSLSIREAVRRVEPGFEVRRQESRLRS